MRPIGNVSMNPLGSYQKAQVRIRLQLGGEGVDVTKTEFICGQRWSTKA